MEPTTASEILFRFGMFEADSVNCTLTRSGARVKIQEQPFRFLLILLEHPGATGLRTRYAHLSKVFVEIGDYVKQGDKIGLMGQTGDATGCHLHFEIYGAEFVCEF